MPRDPRELEIRIGGYTVGQFPNPPLLVAAAAALAGWLADEDATLEDAAESAFYVALTVWAYEEATGGVNVFRKALGAAGLALVLVRLAQRLG